MSTSSGHRDKGQLLKLALLLVLTGIAIVLWWKPWDGPPPPLGRLPVEFRYEGEAAQELADYLREQWQGDAPAAPSVAHVEVASLYIGLRSQGQLFMEAWRPRGGLDERIEEAFEYMLSALGEDAARVDTIELFITLGIEPIDGREQWSKLRSNIHRGRVGLQFGKGPMLERYSPTQVLAKNRAVSGYQKKYLDKYELEEGDLRILPYAFLHGPQLLVSLNDQGPARSMSRGNQLVAPNAVNRDALARFLRLETQWLHQSLHEDGRMTYVFNPSQGAESPAEINNLIRQFMATVALGRIARRSASTSDWEKSTRNLDYNLRTFYSEEEGLGIAEWNDKVKLGALALLALAIVEHQDRPRWAAEEAALLKSIDALWEESGRFRSFLRPEGHRDFDNFYPGEALLLWATLYAEAEDPALLERFMKSFRYYREWHLDPGNRNPAFIPWHTQAYRRVWEKTKDPELAAFVFEMNDWLIEIQEWEQQSVEDTRGRFYAERYGPPHASSTGVYLEGLVAAYRMAEALGESERQERYRVAIVRGLRSLMQLQFVDEVDMFYIPLELRPRVQGGLRTTVYDNKIRCDNVQHSLMAAIEIFESTAID